MSNDYNDPRWQKKRLLCMDRDGWKCVRCGDAESTLHVHHKRYCGNIWDSPLEDLQTLCAQCHASLGQHPKAGVWWQRIGDLNKKDISSSTWGGKDNKPDDSFVALAVQHCQACGSHEFTVIGESLVCYACKWITNLFEHIYLHAPAHVVNENVVKKRADEEELERKRKHNIGQLRSWARKCREVGFTDADVFNAAFPEHAVPIGLSLCDDGSLRESGLLADEIQRLKAYLTSGMPFGDIAFELVGENGEARKALAAAGY
jgi:hypothetical protein